MLNNLPMIDAINEAFGETVVRGVMTIGSDPAVTNFHRSTTPEILDASFNEALEFLGAGRIALPRKYDSEDNDRLISLAAGHGYIGGELNPNPAGMGLVTTERGLALGTPWSDAPAWVAVYVDPTDPRVRVIASGTGIWHLLRFGTAGQTLALIRSEVERLGAVFDIQNLWVTTSPGARSTGDWPFRLDEMGVAKALSGVCAAHPEMITSIGEGERPYALDLSGMVEALWLDQGIDPKKFYFDDRTNNEVGSASKREADAADPRGSATVWASELIFGVLV